MDYLNIATAMKREVLTDPNASPESIFGSPDSVFNMVGATFKMSLREIEVTLDRVESDKKNRLEKVAILKHVLENQSALVALRLSRGDLNQNLERITAEQASADILDLQARGLRRLIKIRTDLEKAEK